LLEKERQNMKLSYESDGIMGTENQQRDLVTRDVVSEEAETDFFNITQNSE